MSCLGKLYNPIPPRVWSRVDSPCQYAPTTPTNSNETIYVPLFKKTLYVWQLQHEFNMLNKGNVLQYKNNSSNLTKSQIYTQIAKNMWTNRNTSYATQTQIYSNPNTKSLKRVNYQNITLDGVPTTLPLTCPPVPTTPVNNTLPNNVTSATNNPEEIPPPPVTQPSNPPTIPDDTPIIEEPPIVIPDGGTLVCNIVENICTGEVLDRTYNMPCHPTTDSNVPGPIIELCWNNGIQTWYPRQRYIMPVSGNKFPVNYKGFVSADQSVI